MLKKELLTNMHQRARSRLGDEQLLVSGADKKRITISRSEFDSKISLSKPSKFFTELARVAEKEGVHVQEYAELLISDAKSLRNIASHRWTTSARRVYRTQNSRMYRRMMRFFVVAHIGLCFFEPVSLHDRSGSTWTIAVNATLISIYLADLFVHCFWDLWYWEDYISQEDVLNNSIGTTKLRKTFSMRLGQLTESTATKLVRRVKERIQDIAPFMRTDMSLNWILVVQVFLISLLVLGLAVGNQSFTRPLRGFLLIVYSERLQSVAYAVLRTVVAILDIIGLILIVLVLFSIIGLYIFPESLYEPEDAYSFRSFSKSLLTMFSLMTTEIYPEVMTNPWAENSLYSIFFVVFLCVCTFTMLALLTAVMFESYSYQKTEMASNAFILERIALTEAFRAMTYDQDVGGCTSCITRPQWGNAKITLQKAGGTKVTESLMKIWFDKLDQNHDGQISLSEFFELCEALLWREYKHSRGGEVLTWWQKEFILKIRTHVHLNHKWIYNVATSAILNHFITFVVLVDVTALAWYSPELSHRGISVINSIDFLCSCIFIFESTIKIAGLGEKYFTEVRYKFEFGILGITLISEILALIRLGFLTRVFKSLRALRVLRVLETTHKSRLLARAVYDAFRGGLVQLGGLIFIVLYFFSTIGMELYAHKLNDNPYADYTSISFSSSTLAPYQTFDSFPLALLACFQVMTSSNWHVLMYETMKQTSGTAAIFFVTMYFTLSIVSVNIVGGLVWVVYQSTLNNDEEESENEQLSRTDDESQTFRTSTRSSSKVRSFPVKSTEIAPQGVKTSKTLKRKSAERWAKGVSTKNFARRASGVNRLRAWDKELYPKQGVEDQDTDGMVLRRMDSASMRIYRDVDPATPVVRHTTFVVCIIVHLKNELFLTINEENGDGWYLPSGPSVSLEDMATAATRVVRDEAGVQVALRGILRLEYAPVIPLYGPNMEARLRIIYVAEPHLHLQPYQKNKTVKCAPNARWMKLKEIEDMERKHMTRGPELLQFARHVANKMPMYPLDLFQTDLSGLANPPAIEYPQMRSIRALEDEESSPDEEERKLNKGLADSVREQASPRSTSPRSPSTQNKTRQKKSITRFGFKSDTQGRRSSYESLGQADERKSTGDRQDGKELVCALEANQNASSPTILHLYTDTEQIDSALSGDRSSPSGTPRRTHSPASQIFQFFNVANKSRPQSQGQSDDEEDSEVNEGELRRMRYLRKAEYGASISAPAHSSPPRSPSSRHSSPTSPPSPLEGDGGTGEQQSNRPAPILAAINVLIPSSVTDVRARSSPRLSSAPSSPRARQGSEHERVIVVEAVQM